MAVNIKKLLKPKIKPNEGSLEPDYAGWDGGNLREMVPNYALAPSEKEIKNQNNARIILGRDRNGSIFSGYGGKGNTRSGAIDIVVGLQGWSPGENYKPAKFDKNGNLVTPESFGEADKNFGSMNNKSPGDAARIYISQRADIDDYFDIANGSTGKSVASSAIAIKADDIRILSRKSIKLVTNKGETTTNSMGGKVEVCYGIDLIAGNRDGPTGLGQKVGNLFGFKPNYLQPIPKGENLVHYLDELTKNVLLLNGISAGLMIITPLLSNAVLNPKTGLSAIGGPVTTFPGLADLSNVGSYLSILSKQMSKLIQMQTNITGKRLNFLEQGGHHYINSKFNRTN